MHIIIEVKAEVIRFSPYRLALVGPHKIKKCLILRMLVCPQIFIYGQIKIQVLYLEREEQNH